MYEEILVPTDGSDGANTALEHAASLAAEQGARLHVLFVVNPTASSYEGVTYDFQDALENAGNDVVERARTLATEAGVDRVEGTTVHGVPHRAIVDYAEDDDIDVIVMGTHGRSGLSRLLIGSVTEKVVRASPVPVLTVRSPEDGTEDVE